MLPVRQQALPNLKRKQKVLPLTERAQLERVLGFTVANNAALATDPNTGLVAYPAGCVIVLYNPRKNKQSHLVNTSKKAITCLAFSRDGQYLATGECGHQPAVRVWDVEEQTQVTELKGHKFGINVVAFCPNQRYLVSIGSQYDMNICVWNWKTQTKVASNKVATKVTDVGFTEDGGTLVTVGNRHVKFWNMDSSKSRIKETVPLKGHSGILGEQKNNYFCGVCCGCGEAGRSTFVVTRSGLLCELNERRLMDKWVELRTTSAHCLAAGKCHIFVGCANGVVRIFTTTSLHFLATMSTPHHLGVDVASGLDPSSVLPAPEDAQYPDAIAMALDDEASRLTVIYNDHSLYIWDVHDIRRIGKVRSFLYHGGPIWGLKFYPILECGKQALPAGSFITCSSDDTIRVWNTEMHMSTDTAYKRNIYSNELIKVVYTDPDLTNILDVEFNPAGGTDKTDNQERENSGVRSLSVSHDGQHLASGDRVGNIRIHSLQFMDQLHMMEAHDSDVMCLNYTHPQSGSSVLASAGRDRLLHVFDCTNNYDLVQTLDDHSAAITSVQFILKEGNLTMLSCGADKSILFRAAQKDPNLQFVLNRHLVAKSTFYDMCVDPKHKFMATACQDRNIRIYNTKNGKQKKMYSGSLGSDGTLVRLDLDRSGSYVATSCTDKNLAIYDFFTGECMASMTGHSEVVTGLQFSPDLKHLVSVSCDGCIFQWRLQYELTEQMQARMNELEHSHATNGIDIETLGEDHFRPSKAALSDLLLTPDKNANVPSGDPPASGQPSLDYRFSVGQLPSWAKRQISDPAPAAAGSESSHPPGGPKGCWAQRVDDEVVIKSVLDESALNGGQAESDRLRLTMGEDSMGEDSILDQTDVRPMVQTIIADDESNKDEDDDEDDEFTKMQSEDVLNQLESRMNFNGSYTTKVTYRRGDNNDLDDDPLPEKDVVVFFPPKADDQSTSGETSSYKVFEGDNRSVAESEGTEPQSLDSDDEDPSRTSLPDMSGPASPDEEQFMRSNFPLDLDKEEFGSTFKEPLQVPAELSHRLSISTRFLTRSQQQQLRNATKTNLQKRQEEMTQAVMETRRRLQALGWKNGDTANRTATVDQAIPERDLTPTSPPSSPSKNADDRGGAKRQAMNSRTQAATRDRSDSRGPPSPHAAYRRAVERTSDSPQGPGSDRRRLSETPERRRWGNKSTPVAANVRKWNSMVDVTGRSLSPAKSQSAALSSPRLPRSRTPTPLSSGRLSLPRTRASSPSPSRHGLRPPRPVRKSITRGHRGPPTSTTPSRVPTATRKSCLPLPQWRHQVGSGDSGDDGGSGAGDSDQWELMSDVSEGERGSTERGSQPLNRSRQDTDPPEPSPNRSTSMQNLFGGGAGGGGGGGGGAGDGAGTDAKTGKPVQRSRSYRSATQSSKAKNRQSMGISRDLTAASGPTTTTAVIAAVSTATVTTTVTTTANPAPPPRRSVGRKGRLNPALKNKFKSTPDLTIPENDVTPRLSPSKTTEDVGGHLILQRRGSADLYQHSSQSSHDKTELFDLRDKERLGQRFSDPGTKSSSVTMGGTSTTTTASSGPSALMPPPVTSTVPKVSLGSRQPMPELTLEQAKEIVRNPTSAVTGSSRRAKSSNTSHETVNGATVNDRDSWEGMERMAASPMDLPEKDTASRLTFPITEHKTNHVNLVFTTPTRPDPPTPTESPSISSAAADEAFNGNALNDKRNVTFVVSKDGPSPQPSSPVKGPANPCLTNSLSRLGSSLSPIHTVGGEPDVDGQENEHESLPFISDSASMSAEPTLPAENQNSAPPKFPPRTDTTTTQPPNLGSASNVLTHLTRRRDPNSRNCVSPIRQLSSTVTIPLSTPPNIPVPKTPPRAVAPPTDSSSPTKDAATGRMSPTKSLSALNRESAAMSARWQRAQQNRDQRQQWSNLSSRSNSIQGSESESEASETATLSSSSSPSSVRRTRAGSEPKPNALELKSLPRDTELLAKGRILKSPLRETSSVAMEAQEAGPKPGMTVEEPEVSPSNGHLSPQQSRLSSNVPDEIPETVADSDEIKRPDKTRSSPPASLISAVTVSVQHSVVLTQPSPAIVTSPVSLASPRFPADPSTATSQASLPGSSPVTASRPHITGDLSRSMGDITTTIIDVTSLIASCQTAYFSDSGVAKTAESLRLWESLEALQTLLSRILGPSRPDLSPLLLPPGGGETREDAADRVTQLLDHYSRELVSCVRHLAAADKGPSDRPS